jgi:anthranilate phosphoribosyltransferase
MRIKQSTVNDLRGGDIKTNLKILLEVLEGRHGPHRDIVVLNSAYALYTAERVASVAEGFRMAEKSIDSGAAEEKLSKLKEFTQNVR